VYYGPSHPNYRPPGAEPVEAPAAPAVEGMVDADERLATLARAAWQDGPETELRVGLAELNGRHFLSIKVWSKSRTNGQWWPDKGKAVTVRLGEAETVAAAILDGLERAGGAPEPKGGGGRPDRRTEWAPRQPARVKPEPAVPPSGGQAPPTFDEFDS